MKIEYTKVGDYEFPNLKMEKQTPLGKYALLRKKYLKEHHQGLYHKLLVNNELNDHLMLVQEQAEEMYDRLVIDYKKQRNITEELKEKDQMRWVQEMNNISNCVDEIINHDIIYN